MFAMKGYLTVREQLWNTFNNVLWKVQKALNLQWKATSANLDLNFLMFFYLFCLNITHINLKDINMIYYTTRQWIEVRAFTSKCLVCMQPVKAYIDPLLVYWSIFPDLKKLFKMHICVSLPAAKYNIVKMETNIFNTRKKNK